ncbi:MAG: hypothetical protein WC941_09555 [Candidatus Bathyarchaeia archaeon]
MGKKDEHTHVELSWLRSDVEALKGRLDHAEEPDSVKAAHEIVETLKRAIDRMSRYPEASAKDALMLSVETLALLNIASKALQEKCLGLLPK